MAGARGSVKTIAKGRDFDEGRCAAWIHLCGRGREEQRDTGCFKLRAVVVEGARIDLKVFASGKLRRVHKDGDSHGVALCQRAPHEREMPLMQRAHGGDEAECPSALERSTSLLHLSDCGDNLHGQSFPAG